MTIPVPSENPCDVNYGPMYSGATIRKAMHEWINNFNANPDDFEIDGLYDADQMTDYLIELITKQNN
jgi:hypothetical protein